MSPRIFGLATDIEVVFWSGVERVRYQGAHYLLLNNGYEWSWATLFMAINFLVHYIDRLQRIVRKQSAPILHAWWHLGQAAICVEGELESALATTFTVWRICSARTPRFWPCGASCTSSFEAGIHACIHLVSTRVFSIISRRQLGQFAAASKT
jgi:hypothetical protein